MEGGCWLAANGSNGGGGRASADEAQLRQLFELLHRGGLLQRGLPHEFTPSRILIVLSAANAVLAREPICLRLASPAVLFGDIHGEFHSLVKLTELLGQPPKRQFLFLGDYVDRGAYSIETALYLLLLKVTQPQHVHLLRGNHEDRRIYRYFNFEDDLMRRFGSACGQSLSQAFNTTFCHLPVCAVLNDEVFCCHGGISPHFNHPEFAKNLEELVSAVNRLRKPLVFRKSDFVADLLWSDAMACSGRLPDFVNYGQDGVAWLRQRGVQMSASAVAAAAAAAASSSNSESACPIEWAPNPRGCSFVFTRAACRKFLQKYKLRWLVRAHMFVPNGCRFELGGSCVTVFSAADYAQKFTNPGAFLFVGAKSESGRFPGKVVKFYKRRLLAREQPLAANPADWPDEIS